MLSRFNQSKKVTYITAPVFMFCNGFTKLSLLTFYLHLSPQKWWRIAVWTSIGIVTLYASIISLIMFFHCQPISKAFDFKIQGGSCIDAGALYVATAVSNIVTDIILFVLPIPMIYQLRLGWVQKMGAIIIFGIGSMYVKRSQSPRRYYFEGKKSERTPWKERNRLTPSIQDCRNIRCAPRIPSSDTQQHRCGMGRCPG